MIQLQATIKWRLPEEGGLATRAFSGIRPSFSVAGDLITSQVFRMDGGDTMTAGENYDVLIKLPYGEIYRESISVEMIFNLHSGKQILADGVVTAIKGAVFS